MQSKTVRRSCQPMPGPIGSPVARSHTIVLARWLVMPTATGAGPRPRTVVAAPQRRLGSSPPRRTRRVRGTGCSVASTATRWRRPAADRRRGPPASSSCRRRGRARRTSTASFPRTARCETVGWIPAERRRCPSNPPSNPANTTTVKREHGTEPPHLVTADEPDDDEHGLGGDVGAAGGHESVAQRKSDSLDPRRAPGADEECDRWRRSRRRRRAPSLSPLAAIRAAIASGTANTSETAAPARDCRPIPARRSRSTMRSRRSLTARGRRRTAMAGRACRG